MTANTVNGSRNGARSGAHTLSLLAVPLITLTLRALSDGPLPQADLRREAGSPAQTTLRVQLKRLAAIGAIEKHRRNRFPGVLEHELTAPGRELLFVVDVLESWLKQAPDGPLTLGGNPAKAAVKGLAESWSTTMLRALAATPLSLTRLDDVIDALNYPSLERRLGLLRLTGLVKPHPGNGSGTPYAVTDWLRQGVGPLTAAARWERRHLPQSTSPIGRLDVETAFLLAVPPLRPPTGLHGRCRLAVEVPSRRKRALAGVVAEVRENGTIGSCSTQLSGHPDAWALGSPAAWLNAVIDREVDNLEIGGDRRLAGVLVEGLHDSLFESKAGATP